MKYLRIYVENFGNITDKVIRVHTTREFPNDVFLIFEKQVTNAWGILSRRMELGIPLVIKYYEREKGSRITKGYKIITEIK